MNLDLTFFSWPVISGFLLKGFYFSVFLTVVATLGGIFFGTLLALMRLSGKKWLDVPAAIYVNGMRSIPLVMMILWFFLLVPNIIGRPIGPEYSAIITFIAFEAAYFSEIMRAGIESIGKTQLEAADCLGLSRLQTITHIVLLPAMERVYPALSSQFVLLMLASSVTSQISAEELTAIANVMQSDTYRSFEVYLIVAVVYIALSFLYRFALWLIGSLLFVRRRKLGTAL